MFDDDLRTRFPGELFGYPWFHNIKDRRAFEAMELGCVFVIGNVTGTQIKIGATKTLVQRLSGIQAENWRALTLRDLRWCQGPLIAQRVDAEARSILTESGRSIRGLWFDLPKEMIAPVLNQAAARVSATLMGHDQMLRRFIDEQERMHRNRLRKYSPRPAAMLQT